MQTVIICVLAVSLAVLTVRYICQGRLLDKISDKYISDHNCLRSFVGAYMAEETEVTKR